jgi:dolichyl-phosphate-mannose--protein O-mannosyl transferase
VAVVLPLVLVLVLVLLLVLVLVLVLRDSKLQLRHRLSFLEVETGLWVCAGTSLYVTTWGVMYLPFVVVCMDSTLFLFVYLWS